MSRATLGPVQPAGRTDTYAARTAGFCRRGGEALFWAGPQSRSRHADAHRISAADPGAGHGGPPAGGLAVGAGRTRRSARLRFDLGRRFDPGPAAARALDPAVGGRGAD